MSAQVPLLVANSFDQRRADLEQKTKSLAKDFKSFILKGNVFDLAVAVIIGAAFQAVVNSFATDILQPPIGLLIGSQLVNAYVVLRAPVNVSEDTLHTPHDVAAAGGVTWNYGNFLQSLLNLLIIGLVLFGFVKMYIWLSKAFKQKKEEAAAAAAPTTAPCPQCLEPINVLAIRCRHCTSWLDPEAQLPKSFTNLRDAERAKQEAVAAAAAAAAAAASAINDSDEEFPASRQRPISKRSLLD